MIDNFTDIELEREQWRDIDGYEGMYQVSDLGRVRSRKSGEWKVMKANKRRDGYLQVVLYQYGKQKRFFVHRLVAQSFIENNDETKTQINHINEVKSENRVSNLEWCDNQYNSTYNLLRKRQSHPKYKQNEIKSLYNPELSIKENLELFKANGIDCSKTTVMQLRRDLNLKHRSNYKRNEIRHLYSQELSIDKNIELFQANGIDCSRETVLKLRKDLGLTKQYRPRKKTN